MPHSHTKAEAISEVEHCSAKLDESDCIREGAKRCAQFSDFYACWEREAECRAADDLNACVRMGRAAYVAHRAEIQPGNADAEAGKAATRRAEDRKMHEERKKN